MVKPLRDGQSKLANQYKEILTSASGIEIFDITIELSERAAELRAKYNLHTPDAIQIATAIENKSDYFLTNDIKLKSISEINSITLSEL
jgi:predicted nucleic acid-binding protein